jgi:nucleotide-binding universal stress UspA family protein
MEKQELGQGLKIIWAVDPSAKEELQSAAISAIKLLATDRSATIEPVYFLSTVLDSTPSQTFGDTIALTRAGISDRFQKLLGRQPFPKMRPLTVLTGTDFSKCRMATELNSYAKLQSADVIVLATHGRTGLERWLLGSFAESLMQESEIPLLVVDPHSSSSDVFNTILFPTDFSDLSKEAYLEVLGLAKALHASITIFHKVALTITPELHLMLTRYPEYERIRDQKIKDCRDTADNWAQEARQQNVDVSISVNENFSESLIDGISKEQRRVGGIIALAPQSGGFSPTPGRTIMAIIHGSSSPVWVQCSARKNVSAPSSATSLGDAA